MKNRYGCPKCGHVLTTVYDLDKEKGRVTLCPLCRTKLVRVIEPSRYICAIRRTPEGKEWADTLTISGSVSVSLAYAEQGNKDCGSQWAEANLIVRTATVEIREVQA